MNRIEERLAALKEEGKKEVDEIKWETVGYKVREIYDNILRNY